MGQEARRGDPPTTLDGPCAGGSRSHRTTASKVSGCLLGRTATIQIRTRSGLAVHCKGATHRTRLCRSWPGQAKPTGPPLPRSLAFPFGWAEKARWSARWAGEGGPLDLASPSPNCQPQRSKLIRPLTAESAFEVEVAMRQQLVHSTVLASPALDHLLYGAGRVDAIMLIQESASEHHDAGRGCFYI